MTNQLTATIRPGFEEINVRMGPGTGYSITFKTSSDSRGLRVLDVRPDDEDKRLQGKTYQWFRLIFADKRVGWVRDDLINIQGDGTTFGYGMIMTPTYAFDLKRAVSNKRKGPTSSLPISEPQDLAKGTDQERIIKAAFNITAAFEGGSYAAYQTYDRGIVSYGRFQFTLQSGSLSRVVDRYLANADSAAAQTLRDEYQERLKARDASLRNDNRLKTLLQDVATESVMQSAQDQVAREQYWDTVFDLSILPRGIKTPLAQALVFDIGVQHGTRHSIYSRAEEDIGVPPKSRLGDNGITEEQLIQRIAEIRRQILYRIAEQQDLPGVKDRADFWLQLINEGDWQLQGDQDGKVTILGRQVQVRDL